MLLGYSFWGIISLVCFVWVVYEVWAVNQRLSTGSKVIWSIAALFFNILTAIVYYIMEKRN